MTDIRKEVAAKMISVFYSIETRSEPTKNAIHIIVPNGISQNT